MQFLLTTLAIVWLLVACQGGSPPADNAQTPTSPTTDPVSVLDRVKKRGRVICGVNGRLPGFSYLSGSGKWSGIEIDLCRAIASGVLGKPEAITLRPLTANDRFVVLKKGEIDVLFRNTAITLTRSADPAIAFAPAYFHDSQGILVRLDSLGGFPALSDLDGQTICTEGGDSQIDAANFLKANQVKMNVRTSGDSTQTLQLFVRGECNAVSLPLSELQGWQKLQTTPANWRILPVSFGARQPLSAVVSAEDQQWHSIVSWVIYTTIYGEELGINQTNYPQFQKSEDKDIARFLGTKEGLGILLGLPPDWTTQILKAVGNYGNMYDRNLGGLPRGQNRLAKNGGLLVSMPFR